MKDFRLQVILLFIAGFLTAFSMPPFGIWPLLFAGIGSLYYYLSSQSGWRAFAMGWAFGFGYFLAGLYWIGNALLVPGNPYVWAWPLAVAGLPVALGLFTALACLTITKLADLKKWRGYAVFVAILGLTEWLRGHIFTGFPWNLFGYSWSHSLSMMQSVSVVGIYGLTAMTIAWASLPGYIFASRMSRKAASVTFLIFITSINIVWMAGSNRLAMNPTRVSEQTIIRIVQPNIAQEDKWDGTKTRANFNALIDASTAPTDPDKMTAVIWPETALTDSIIKDEHAAGVLKSAMAGSLMNGLLITGILDRVRDEQGEPIYYNSLTAYDRNLQALTTFHKSHLVPFGEYIPYQRLIPLKPIANFAGFTPGSGAVTQQTGRIPPYAGLVCYEVIFPGAVVGTDRTAEWIINVTNDGWYGDSPGPYQHLAKAVTRSIEEGLPLARSANTGISAIIDSYGRIVARIPYGETGYADYPLPQKSAKATLYARFRDYPVLAILLISLFLPVIAHKRTMHAA